MGNTKTIEIADKIRLIQAAKRREQVLAAARNKGSISLAAQVRWQMNGVGR